MHGIGRVNRNLEAQFQTDWSRAILRAARCAVPGCDRRATDAHHVVYKRDLKDRGLFLWDLRDGMPLCHDCHSAQHYSATPLPLTLLTDTHLDFAFEVLAAYAFDYLRRRYRGDDPRLEARLATCTEEPQGSVLE